MLTRQDAVHHHIKDFTASIQHCSSVALWTDGRKRGQSADIPKVCTRWALRQLVVCGPTPWISKARRQRVPSIDRVSSFFRSHQQPTHCRYNTSHGNTLSYSAFAMASFVTFSCLLLLHKVALWYLDVERRWLFSCVPGQGPTRLVFVSGVASVSPLAYVEGGFPRRAGRCRRRRHRRRRHSRRRHRWRRHRWRRHRRGCRRSWWSRTCSRADGAAMARHAKPVPMGKV